MAAIPRGGGQAGEAYIALRLQQSQIAQDIANM